MSAAASSAGRLVDALGAPQPMASQHLRVLRATGLVTGARHHRQVDYRLVDGHIAHIVRAALAHAGHESPVVPLVGGQDGRAGWSAARATMA